MKTPRSITCQEAVVRLVDFLNGELDEGRHAEVEAHMDACRACFSRKEFERRLKHAMGQLGREAAPADMRSRIQKLVRGF